MHDFTGNDKKLKIMKFHLLEISYFKKALFFTKIQKHRYISLIHTIDLVLSGRAAIGGGGPVSSSSSSALGGVGVSARLWFG